MRRMLAPVAALPIALASTSAFAIATIQFAQPGYTVNEADGNITIEVSRTVDSVGVVTVDYTTVSPFVPNRATADVDYTTTSDTLTWADGDTANKTITIPILGDADLEQAETFTVQLSNPSVATAQLGALSTAAVTITDAAGSLQFSQPAYTIAEDDVAGQIQITVSRTGGSTGAASVTYTVSDGVAVVGEDYTVPAGSAGTLSWTDTDAADKTITISIIDDANDPEGNETVNLALSNPVGASLGAVTTATLNITDQASDSVQFTGAVFNASEADGTASLSVTRSGTGVGAVSVTCATDDANVQNTATAGADYTSTSTVLSWADGDTATKNCDVPVLTDASADGTESVFVDLSGVTGDASLGGIRTAQLVITDAGGALQFGQPVFNVNEGDGTATITVSRTGGTFGAISVDYTTADGTAFAPADYATASGTLDWADGDGEDKTFSVSVVDDGSLEPAENVALSLSNPQGGASLGLTDTATLQITDSAGSIQFSQPAYATPEIEDVVTVTVSRIGGSTGAVTVDYTTTDGSATIADGDYDTASGTLSWADGDTADKSFTVQIHADASSEGTETVNLSLNNVVGANLGGTGSAVISITDGAGNLQFTQPSFSTFENLGDATISVTRVNGATGAVSVDYDTADDTATAGTDYVAASGTLSWADGEYGEKTFVVSVTPDGDIEGDETLTLSLSNATGGATLNGIPNATLTIQDFTAGTLGFTATNFDVQEYAGTATITVTRIGGSTGAVTVDYACADGTATSGSDYSEASGTLSWADGETGAKTFTLPVQADAEVESDETVLLSLTSATGGAVIALDAATLTILDAAPTSTSTGSGGGGGGAAGPWALLTLALLWLGRRKLR